MDPVIDDDEQETSKILAVKDHNGRLALTVGLIVTVYFENQLSRGMRQAVADVAADYLELMKDQLRWKAVTGDKRYTRVDHERIATFGEWLLASPEGESWDFAFHGGETSDAASAIHVEGFGSPTWSDGGLGFLHMSFPLLWFTEGPATFPEHVLGVCRRIKPLSGYAGIGLLEPSDRRARSRYEPAVRQIAERFPGLEIEERAGHVNHLRNGIKGVNWLTILAERWIEEVGGLEYLRVRLGEEFGFYTYDGGVIIQAGPKPQLGDVEANRWPQLYVTLARVLKKIQIKEHYPFHFAGADRMNYAASNAWLNRFDGK